MHLIKNYLAKIFYHLLLILRNNLFLGIYFIIRSRILDLRSTNKCTAFTNQIKNLNLPLNEYRKFFTNNNTIKEKLLEQADNIQRNKLNIWEHSINITDYHIDNFLDNYRCDDFKISDLRFWWEIYRYKFIHYLGLAYVLTGKADYSKKLISLLNSWEEYSPLKSTVIRYNGMESSIKLINLSWFHYYLSDCKEYNDSLQKILICAIITHARNAYKNYDITKYGLESNHGLTCAVGLIYAGCLFPNSKEAMRWLRFGKKYLIRALKNQFSSDGVNFESSIQYHRFTFELLVYIIYVLEKNDKRIESFLIEKVKLIGNALLAFRHSNCNIPRIGDNDAGKILIDLYSAAEFNDLTYLNFFTEASDTHHYLETLIFADSKILKNILSQKANKIRYNNYYALKNEDISLFIVGHEIGTKGKGNHQHNDFLSFELYGQKPFIVDPWSYCYTGDKNLRNKDRQTNRHSTVEIDKIEIVEFDKNTIFEFKGNISIDHKQYISDKYVRICLTHNGYENIKTGSQIVSREYIFYKDRKEVILKDFFYGKGIHQARLSFLIPDKYWQMEKKDDRNLLFYNSLEEFVINSNWANLSISEDYISELFLNRTKATCLTFSHEYKNCADVEITIKYRRLYND